MLSDTHFHFLHTCECGADPVELLSAMADDNYYFAMDAGTHADGLLEHAAFAYSAINAVKDEKTAEKAKNMLYFSAGIWPAPEAIRERDAQMKILRGQIEEFRKTYGNDKLCCIGECGLDHHWNPSGVDGRSAEDFDRNMIEGEREMFLMQLELGREFDLPVMVHSRDAFEETLEVIKESGYNKGEIHCFSYDIEAAKAFLDLGWYIALGGGVTYTKKSKLAAMDELIRYIPDDLLLLETDAPYLAPVPFRGTTNSPLLIKHTYDFIASAKQIPVEILAENCNRNIDRLYKKC
ncbi:MAG: TatD family hydrolase [Treponemataceae bacterium]|nr:TatD family hydrolase [Treponemataceae bacterium]